MIKTENGAVHKQTLQLKCKFCDIEYTTSSGRGLHEIQCKNNPNKKITKHVGRVPWNKGLDKSDSRVKKYSDGIRKAMKARWGAGFKSPAQTAEYWTLERRLEKSKWKKELHKASPELHPNRLLANNKLSMTYPEKIAYNFLEKSGVHFEHQKKIDKYFVDFCVGKIVIEIDGEHWHPINNQVDRNRDAVINNLGYVVHRIRSKEIIENRIKHILLSIV